MSLPSQMKDRSTHTRSNLWKCHILWYQRPWIRFFPAHSFQKPFAKLKKLRNCLMQFSVSVSLVSKFACFILLFWPKHFHSSLLFLKNNNGRLEQEINICTGWTVSIGSWSKACSTRFNVWFSVVYAEVLSRWRCDYCVHCCWQRP